MSKEIKYIVRKYVMATSLKDAVKKEKNQEVDEVFIDKDWSNDENKKGKIGF